MNFEAKVRLLSAETNSFPDKTTGKNVTFHQANLVLENGKIMSLPVDPELVTKLTGTTNIDGIGHFLVFTDFKNKPKLKLMEFDYNPKK